MNALVFSIIGGITGIAGMIIGVAGIINNRFLAVHNYFLAMEDPEFVSARSAVYNCKNNMDLNNKDIAIVINFFHHWGLLAKKHYLPLWIFDSGSSAGVIRLYELCCSYIKARRKEHNDNTYASNFEWLYITLLKRRKKWL